MVVLAGWMNRQQQEVIEYLRTENRILREKLGHTERRPEATAGDGSREAGVGSAAPIRHAVLTQDALSMASQAGSPKV